MNTFEHSDLECLYVQFCPLNATQRNLLDAIKLTDLTLKDAREIIEILKTISLAMDTNKKYKNMLGGFHALQSMNDVAQCYDNARMES